MSTEAQPLEATIDVTAPPEKVWDLVSNLPRMAEWSPQVVKSMARGPIKQGSVTLNVNRSGWKVWPTRSKVVRYELGRDIAFKVLENGAVWSFALEPTDTGTRVTQRREVPRGIYTFAAKFEDIFLGGLQNFEGELREGMAQTLARIKAEAEA